MNFAKLRLLAFALFLSSIGQQMFGDIIMPKDLVRQRYPNKIAARGALLNEIESLKEDNLVTTNKEILDLLITWYNDEIPKYQQQKNLSNAFEDLITEYAERVRK